MSRLKNLNGYQMMSAASHSISYVSFHLRRLHRTWYRSERVGRHDMRPPNSQLLYIWTGESSLEKRSINLPAR